MAGRIDGKVALVTGGASGIGRSCALKLAEEGAAVVVTDIQESLGAEVVSAIMGSGGRASFLHHDVTSEPAWEDVIAATKDEFGRLDVLVNNAGIGVGGSIIEMALQDWQRQQAIKCYVPYGELGRMARPSTITRVRRELQNVEGKYVPTDEVVCRRRKRMSDISRMMRR